MFFDGRSAQDSPSTDYDVVVVGAGPAGITLALELEATGLRIALLESGGQDYDGDTQLLNQGRIDGNDDEYDLETSRLRYFGGASNHWGGHCTPLDAIDFERAPSTGMSGWPFGRAALDPFYERAHDYCDLGAYRYDFASLAPQDADYRLFPATEDVETAVIRQSPPTRFGEKYHDLLEQSRNIHVWFWTNALTLGREPGAREWIDTRTLTGVVRRFSGQAVVLAAGAIECTRIVLFSNAQSGTRLGDAGGLLGRCYMDHPSAGAAFIHFSRPVGDMVYWSGIDRHADDGVPLHFVLRLTDEALVARDLPNFQYYVVPFPDEDILERTHAARQGMRSLRNVAKRLLGRDVASVGTQRTLQDDYCDFIINADELALDRAIGLFSDTSYGRALLRFEAEERPVRSNFVTLDQTESDALGMPHTVLNWATTEDDLAAIRETAALFGGFVGAEGIGRLQIEDHGDDPFWGTTTAWHQLGCMRMAESPTAGVVDPDCRLHGSQGVYVASGAVFPTGGRANPTLTIVALSIRLADHLKSRIQT